MRCCSRINGRFDESCCFTCVSLLPMNLVSVAIISAGTSFWRCKS